MVSLSIPSLIWLSCLMLSSAIPHGKLGKLNFQKFQQRGAERAPSVDARHGHVKYDAEMQQYSLDFTQPTSKEGVVAWGSSLPYLSTQGWDEVHIATNGAYANKQQAYAAGLLEGALTQDRVNQFWTSWTSRFRAPMRNKINTFINVQNTYLRERSADRVVSEESTDPDSIYWHHVGVVLAQLDGMLDGINYNNKNPISKEDLWIMNLDGDILDIERALQSDVFTHDMSRQQLIELIELKGHCSALVKWTGDDLLIGHTTWSDFAELYRSYKHYKFAFRGKGIKSQSSSFSSYPGFVSSTDDYYLLDSGLAIIETTLNILNDDLYLQGVDPSTTVMAWVRNIVANRLAGTGEEWVDLFTRENSGTYNNQWMIVDFNQFEPGAKKLKPGTLWILEQIPGYVQAEDSTDLLQITSYWASYNRPYFKTINEKSMYKHYSDVHGVMFSYLECPRAQIFKREHENVKDMEDMRAIMQFNRYKEDELSSGCPGNSIASRFDLPPLPGSACEIVFVANGATDSKISNYAMAKELTCSTRGGPTYDNVPRFSWQDWTHQIQSNYSAQYFMLEQGAAVSTRSGMTVETTQQAEARLALLRRTQEHYRQKREYEEALVLQKVAVVNDGGEDLRDAFAEQQGYSQKTMLPERATALMLRKAREAEAAKELAERQSVCEHNCGEFPVGQPDLWEFAWFDMRPRMLDL